MRLPFREVVPASPDPPCSQRQPPSPHWQQGNVNRVIFVETVESHPLEWGTRFFPTNIRVPVLVCARMNLDRDSRTNGGDTARGIADALTLLRSSMRCWSRILCWAEVTK